MFISTEENIAFIRLQVEEVWKSSNTNAIALYLEKEVWTGAGATPIIPSLEVLHAHLLAAQQVRNVLIPGPFCDIGRC
jgi:hypothetical protein